MDPWSLPQPRHLVAAASGGLHYHFGHFVSSVEPLDTALHRMTATCATYLHAHSRVLDVGCGAGGSARLLARLGHEVLGVDPCADTLEFAAAAHAAEPGVRFERGELTDFPSRATVERGAEARFDAALMLEVLQHFDDLHASFRAARRVLAPGGRLILADVFCVPRLSRERVPYHRLEHAFEAARDTGFEVLERRSLSRRVRPTPGKLVAAAKRVCAPLAASRPELAAELRELTLQCRALDTALRDGDLVYEVLALGR